MTWSERVAPGVAIMRERAEMALYAKPDMLAAADTLERMAEELDNARQTVMAFAIFNLVLAISAGAYAWRVM